MENERTGISQALFSSSSSVQFRWQGWIFRHCFRMTKEADTEDILFPEAAELAGSSPCPFARMRELPAQHSPFQRSPLLPPALQRHGQHPPLAMRCPVHPPAHGSAVCPCGDTQAHAQHLAHTLSHTHACHWQQIAACLLSPLGYQWETPTTF